MSDSDQGVPSEAEGATNAEILNRLDQLEKQVSDEHDRDDVIQRRPEWVFEQFAQHWQADGKSASGLQPYRSAWKQFTEWMSEEGYQYLTDLTSRFPGRHDDWIVAHETYEKSKLSRGMHLSRLKTVIKHAESRGWVYPDDVPAAEVWDEVKPTVSDGDKIRSDPLPPERGKRILDWVRANHFGSRPHVLWLLLFRYGFRISAIRALDYDDLILTEPDGWPDVQDFRPHLRLRDRPELGPDDNPGLPLKNKRPELAGRRVPLREEHVKVIQCYIENGSPTGAIDSRKEHRDPGIYGLHGLLTGEHRARLSGRTIRGRTHWLTCPSTYMERQCRCEGCERYRRTNGGDPYPSKLSSVCNETRSPHQVRHGAITSLLDDHGHSTVARIVGTSPDTLRDVYDRADEYRRMNRVASDWIR